MNSVSDKIDRALQLGVSRDIFDSFEHNQSCPSLGKPKRNKKFDSIIKGFAKFTGDELNSFNYSHDGRKIDENSFDLEKSYSSIQSSVRSMDNSRPHSRLSLSASWSSSLGGIPMERSNFNPKSSNKAILTIDAETSAILTANKQACCLFNLTSESLLKKNLNELFKTPVGVKKKEALMHNTENDGNIVVVSGKVIEVVAKDGKDIAVSLWLRKLRDHSDRARCLAVLEPVVRITGNFVFDQKGTILSCDNEFCLLHGHPTSVSLIGADLTKIMPSYQLPELGSRLDKSIRKQRVTSTDADGRKFPLSVYIQSREKNENNDILHQASAWLFTNVSGPMTFNSETGSILNVNSNFSLALLGYRSDELKNKNISKLLPDLTCERMKLLACSETPCASSLPELAEESNPDSSPTLIEKQSSERTVTNSSNQVLISSSRDEECEEHLSFDSVLSSNLHYHSSSPSKTALDHINSLLLGKCSPFATPNKEESFDIVSCPESKSPRITQRNLDDSWVDISISHSRNGEAAKDDTSVNDGEESLRKINLLLNGSLDALEGREKPQRDPVLVSHTDTTSTAGLTDASILHPDSIPPVFASTHFQFNRENNEVNVSDCENNHSSVGEFLPNCDNNKENISCKPFESCRGVSNKDGLSLARFPKLCSGNVTSTPLEGKTKSKSRIQPQVDICEGFNEGYARHKDGSMIPVRYEVRRVDESHKMYCVWICSDLERYRFNSSRNSDQTLCSSYNSTLPSLNASAVSGALDFSLGAAIKQTAQRNESPDIVSQEGTDEWNAIQGKFGEKYAISKTIGSGAFGFVKIARHKKTDKKVVVKFIRKEKILEECWVNDYETNSDIPLEIALLTKFEHPNIVKVMNFYENEHFFSMVMSLHGEKGMDLFEFIDREPRINEALCSYLFRQIASAVYFLHKERVVHRDIKDENVIIDENFCCKLIDFGSAAFFTPGKTFGTFCGTMEYCSPEVLMGDRYEGPALEIWALGVTLYTLVYGENPFSDVDETVEGVLKPPHFLSHDLMILIQGMLQPVPEHRWTIKDVVEHPWTNIPIDIKDYSWEDIFSASATKRRSSSHSQVLKEVMEQSVGTMEDSLDSSNENLASYLQRNQHQKSSASKAGKPQPPHHNEKLLPLMRRLENVNLNHSI